MRKLAFIGLLFISCSGEEKHEIWNKYKEEKKDSSVSDSMIIKANDLIKSTQGAEKKVSEIKQIKKENFALKKELIETKAELEEFKASLPDTLEPVKKKKKTFIQKVISTIKKDTTDGR